MTGEDTEKPSPGALGHSRVCATKGSEETPCPEALGPPGTAPARLGTVTPCPALSIPPHPSGLRDVLGPVPGEPWSGTALGGSFMLPETAGFSKDFGFCFCLGVSESFVQSWPPIICFNWSLERHCQ